MIMRRIETAIDIDATADAIRKIGHDTPLIQAQLLKFIRAIVSGS